MPEIMRIKDGIKFQLNEEFLSSDQPSNLGLNYGPSEIESACFNFDSTNLDILIRDAMAKFTRYNTAIDIHITIPLHQALPLTRRQASDQQLWAWLGAAHLPDFVAWRWKTSGNPPARSRDRYVGDRVRQTFARLWWAAELTRDNDDYSMTLELLQLPGFQDIYEAIFGRAFGNFRPAMGAFIKVVGNKKEDFIRGFAKELRYSLPLSVLEAMKQNQLEAMMANLANKMECKRKIST